MYDNSYDSPYSRYEDYSRGVGQQQHNTRLGYNSYENDDHQILLRDQYGSSSYAHQHQYDGGVPPVPSKDDSRFRSVSYYDNSRSDFDFSRDYSMHPLPPPPPHEVPFGTAQPTVMDTRTGWSRFKPKDWRRVPYFVYFISIVQICVFIAELARMGSLTGSPIQTKPSFNPMIGPSGYVMINMGSRFTPCMHYITNVTDNSSLLFPCPNSTSTSTDVCSLSELCGMGGFPNPNKPHQWWRFITPIFLHAGFIHIGFNLLLQLKLGAELEREIGILRFVFVYLSSGIAGFVLGGNFTPDGISSTGASGSLFGVISLDLLDLLFNWQLYESPKFNLFMHICEIIVSFVLGLLPGLDNFSHIGGFAMGVLTGTALLRSPLKVRLVQNLASSDGQFAEGGGKLQVAAFHWRNPSQHFRGRSRWWYVWCLVRVVAIVLAIVYFVVLIKQFENGGGHCSWCKYLSCLPVNGWCNEGEISTSSS